jgi:hypothetical protein
MSNSPFTLSTETFDKHAYQHGFHLGTDELLARQIAEEKFHALRACGKPIITVALMRDGRMVDCYDGAWAFWMIAIEDF